LLGHQQKAALAKQSADCSISWQVIGRVPGVLKMTGRGKEREKAMYGEQGAGADVTSTLAFEPPTLVRWSRFDAAGKTSFITAFYCCPAGSLHKP